MSNPFQDMLDGIYKNLHLPYYSAKKKIVLCRDCNVAFPVLLIDSHHKVCVPRRERLGETTREE